MNPLLVVILGVLIGIGIGILCDWHISRLCARDAAERRRVMEEDREAMLAAYRSRYLCAVRGHRYMLCTEGWHCPVCDDLVRTDDEGGVA